MSRKRSSFTLVEIIAVLLVIAILAAVAAPKFVSIAEEARVGVCEAGINEAKGTLAVAYAKAYIAAYKPDGDEDVSELDILAAALGGTPASGVTHTFGDIEITFTIPATPNDTIVLTPSAVTGGDLPTTVPTGTYTIPSQ